MGVEKKEKKKKKKEERRWFIWDVLGSDVALDESYASFLSRLQRHFGRWSRSIVVLRS